MPLSMLLAVSYTVRYTVRFKRVPNGQEGSISLRRFIKVHYCSIRFKGQGDSRSFKEL